MGTHWKGKGKRYGGGPFSPKRVSKKKGGCFSVLLIITGSGFLGIAGLLSTFLERV